MKILGIENLKDNFGYHTFKIENENMFLDVMLPYFKEEYREFVSIKRI